MQRLILQELLAWKASENRKPLILKGARQVGKTWILKKFGSEHFKQCIYLNFEASGVLQGLFEPDFDLKRILSTRESVSGISVDENTLLIFDEIQEAPKGLTALKYFYENAPEYFVVAAGSFLGVSLQQNHAFPVGKVDFLFLYPLSFEEFLLNSGEELLHQHLRPQHT
jgi:predicted AAA+ superfamily ATPase